MSKVLYIGVYRDGTGWGHAAIDYMMSLRAAGVDVVARPYRLNNNNEPLPEEILEMESKSSKGCDVCIQHILPHLMYYNGDFKKNIGLYVTETSNFRTTNWANHLNMMDEVWVPTKQNVEAAHDSDVNVPIKVVPHACDLSKFYQSYKPMEFRHQLSNDFIFYFIGESVRRKNIAAFVKAFHLEFNRSEPVQLLIKTSLSGMSPNECYGHTVNYLNEIKRSMKLYKEVEDYKKEMIIVERLTEEEMCRLHNSCDCYVSSSFGEAWGIPAFDAMGFGKTPIVTDWGGYFEYVTGKNGWPVDYRLEPVTGVFNTFQDLYTSRENWASIDVNHLRACMREAYANQEMREEKSRHGKADVARYSYENVGKIIKGLL